MRIITESACGESFPHKITVAVNGHQRVYVEASSANARYAEAFKQGQASANPQQEATVRPVRSGNE